MARIARKSPGLTATTAPRHGDTPPHHFFASSAGTWRLSYDVGQLVADMRREGLPFNVWLVCGFREVPDSNYGKSRTRISVSPGQGFR